MNNLILFASGTLDSTTVMILSIAISCGLLAGFCYVALRLRGKLLKTMGEAVDAVLDKFILSRDTGVTAETVGGGVGNITASSSDQAVSTAGGMARSVLSGGGGAGGLAAAAGVVGVGALAAKGFATGSGDADDANSSASATASGQNGAAGTSGATGAGATGSKMQERGSAATGESGVSRVNNDRSAESDLNAGKSAAGFSTLSEAASRKPVADKGGASAKASDGVATGTTGSMGGSTGEETGESGSRFADGKMIGMIASGGVSDVGPRGRGGNTSGNSAPTTGNVSTDESFIGEEKALVKGVGSRGGAGAAGSRGSRGANAGSSGTGTGYAATGSEALGGPTNEANSESCRGPGRCCLRRQWRSW